MSETLTVLHLVSLMGMGGRCATALRQGRLLSARGHRVIFGCIKGATAAERCREAKIDVCDEFKFRRGFRPLDFWSDCSRLAKLCKSEKVDVVHAHVSQESWVACLGMKLVSPRPVLVRSRGVVVPIKPHLFNRWMHNSLTDHLIAPSNVIYKHLNALPGFDASKVSLIADGVDTTRFSPQTSGLEIRKEFGIAPDAPLVVMVARLERVKGHEYFFKALKILQDQKTIPNLRALCACDERSPGMFDKTVKQARDLGLNEQLLLFTGMRKDVEKILAAADVVALPSLGSEGSTRVGLEAGASGKPVVGTSVGCLPEVILDGKTGLIVPPADEKALANAIGKLLNDPALAKELGAAARKRVVENYDEQTMVQRLEEIYRREVAKKRGH